MNWKSAIAACAAAFLTLAGHQAHATQGAPQYPDGAEGFMAGAVPPPGFYFINYLQYYHANRINDNSGNKIPLDTRIDVVAEVPRFIYVSDIQIFGANLGAHILIPIVNLDYDIGPFSGHQFGVGDITVNPFILSWHWPNVHLATGLDIILPTGRYDSSKPLSIGGNYWGFEPLVAGTYLSDGGFEASAKLMYAINTENDDTDYRSGQAFHADFTVAQHFDNLAVGVGGYWFNQTTDDEIAGVEIGNRGRAFALGPQAKYDFNGMSLIAKWQHEFVAENRPQGDKLWLKFIMKL